MRVNHASRPMTATTTTTTTVWGYEYGFTSFWHQDKNVASAHREAQLADLRNTVCWGCPSDYFSSVYEFLASKIDPDKDQYCGGIPREFDKGPYE